IIGGRKKYEVQRMIKMVEDSIEREGFKEISPRFRHLYSYDADERIWVPKLQMATPNFAFKLDDEVIFDLVGDEVFLVYDVEDCWYDDPPTMGYSIQGKKTKIMYWTGASYPRTLDGARRKEAAGYVEEPEVPFEDKISKMLMERYN
ncbi:hypothetical protein FOL47_009689, partial [Perkinsus chesapeaki]